MSLHYLINQFQKNKNSDAIIWKDNAYSYHWLLSEYKYWQEKLVNSGIKSGMVVELSGDFSPKTVALFLALIQLNCIIVPLTNSVLHKKKEFREISGVEVSVIVNTKDEMYFEFTGLSSSHLLIQKLRQQKHPGLILFSSGSTGKSKAAVHDLLPLLKKFEKPRYSKRIIPFLLFDHIGGINTMLYILYNAGCLIALEERTPTSVCHAIELHKAEVLPTSPTFLNLLIFSEEYKQYNLESLELITYGTEVMPEATLKKLNQIFPNIKIQQTYGLSELGILRSKSKSSHSLFVKLGGEGFETRIVDGLLEIKAQSAMLGYLNAPSPFTDDGWFKTGDAVIQEGEYLKILGRQSEMINVGGEKVYPAEIESVLQSLPNIIDLAVFGEKNALVGNVVCLRVVLNEPEELTAFRKRMKAFCAHKLLPYQIPQKIIIANEVSYSARFKKMRKIA